MSNWIDITEPGAGGWRRVRCVFCGIDGKSNLPHEQIRCACRSRQPPPAHGPGTELHKLIAELGITGCGTGLCPQHVAEMDRQGIAWCKENRSTIIGWLKESAATASLLDKLKVAGVLLSQPWFRAIDPIGSIVDEALRRAAAVRGS